MSTCILVLGTPRSGTSCVAGVLHHLGVPMGERLLAADTWNPAGYFQDADFEQLVEMYDYLWDQTRKVAKPEYEATIRPNIRTLIAQRNDQPLWGLKSNRMVHFLGDLHELTELKVIRTSRPKAASIASWRARSGNTLVESTRIINYMNGLIDGELTRLNITPLVLDFRNVITEPRTAIAQIAAFVGAAENEAAFNWIQPNLVRFDG